MATTSEKATLSRKESEIYIGVNRQTLDRLRKRGELPFVRIGKRIVYRRADLDALLTRLATGGELK